MTCITKYHNCYKENEIKHKGEGAANRQVLLVLEE